MIDLYCERLGPGLFAEPLNALSNLSFVVAGLLALRLARRVDDSAALTLAVLILLIGAGSSAFHLTATDWAQWTDVVPIALFQLVFLVTWLQRQWRWTFAKSGGATMVYAVTMAAAGTAAPGLVNGSLAYLPALLVLGVLAFEAQRGARASLLPAAAGLFALSLLARTVDLSLCPYWSFGTHWLWHLMNGAVLYLLVAASCRATASPRNAARQGASPSLSGSDSSRTHSDIEPS